MHNKHIIIGAGLSGLSCASVLRDDCVVLEQDSCIGGLAKTVFFGAFSFDLGGHRFFSADSSLRDFFLRVLGDNARNIKRKSRIFRNGVFVEYPLKPSVLGSLSFRDVVSVFATYAFRAAFPLPERSFADAACNRFGDRLFELFFKGYTEKVWGVPCHKLSPEFMDIRLQKVSLKNAVVHAFFRRNDVASFTDTFLYPLSGIGEFSLRLSRTHDVRLQHAVTGFSCRGNRIESVIVNDSDEIPCSQVVSTMPITRLVELLYPPEKVLQAAKALRYRSLICVFLELDRKTYTDDHWIYFPQDQIFGRLHEPKNWSPAMAPADKTGVCVEIFCDRNDVMWQKDDIQIAHAVISEIPLLKRFEVLSHMVKRVPYAYPVYTVGYREHLDTVKTFLSSYENLFCVGRTGAFQYCNMDVCLAEGLRLGRMLQSACRKAGQCRT